MRQRGLQLFAKLAIDRLVAAFALIALAPLMAIVALTIGLTIGRPVLFRQTRPGFREQLFVIYKFRTMRDAIGPDGRQRADRERLTALGRILRAASIDELPQLWNVIRGDLSLVGPRPLLVEYLPRYSPEQRVRHQVRPGITGWAQIQGRNSVSWDRKFALDSWYVENWSLWLDLKILAITVARVVKGGDTTHPGHVTMPEFGGGGEGAENPPPSEASRDI